MKKVLMYLMIATFSLSIISCGTDKEKEKAKSFEELEKKYDGMNFASCEDFIEFGYEYIDLIVLTIQKAVDGDENALDKLEEIDHFMFQFSEQAEKFYEECPEQFEEFDRIAEEKMAEPMEKLMELMFGGFDDWDEDWDWDEDFDWDDDDFYFEEVEEEVM